MTSPTPQTASRLVAAATATGLAAARRAARGRRRRGRHAGQHHRRAARTGLGAEGVRRLAPARGNRQTTAGLVLRVLLGCRNGRLAGTGRVRRGQQLAGRVHALASCAGPACQRRRVGCVGGDRAWSGQWPRTRSWRSRPTTVRMRSTCWCGYNRVYTGYAPIVGDAVVDRIRADQPLRRGVQVRWAKPVRTPANSSTELTELPREEWPARLRRLISEQIEPDPAPVGRPGPPAVGVRARLVGQPRTPHPHRDGDRSADHGNGHHHDSWVGRCRVREVGPAEVAA